MIEIWSLDNWLWTKTVLGVDLYHLLWWFFIYSFLGWLTESIAMSLKHREIQNRGFVKGPFCTIYAVGALVVYFILRPLSGNYFILYFAGLILATVLEYITAIIMERLFGTFWWDYTDYPLNFRGKICVGNSLIWGLYTILMFSFLQPMVVRISLEIPEKTGIFLIMTITILYLIDFVHSMFKELNIKANIKEKIKVIF